MFYPDDRIHDVITILPARFEDARGHFSEIYALERYAKNGIACEFVQDNQSLSESSGTVRGLHFQTPPFAQAKLVRCVTGRALDIAVDVRVGSPTYGQHAVTELSAESGNLVFVPEGFAHGFCTLEDRTALHYKVSRAYAPGHEGGLAWNDPALGIDWPVADHAAILSDKDRTYPTLDRLTTGFVYDA